MSPAAGEAVPMFRYETHMHTSEVSRCAHATARDMICLLYTSRCV